MRGKRFFARELRNGRRKKRRITAALPGERARDESARFAFERVPRRVRLRRERSVTVNGSNPANRGAGLKRKRLVVAVKRRR